MALRWPLAFGEAGGDAGAVGRAAVLAELALAFERRDRHAQADDTAQLRLDELRRRIRDRPGRGALALVQIGQAGDDVEQAGGIVEELDRAGSVDGDIVPGRHDLARFLFHSIPARRHIGVRACENGEAVADGWHVPLRVRLGEMPVEHAMLALVLIDEERQRRRQQAFRGRGDEGREPRGADRRQQACPILVAEGGWRVHAGTPCVAAVMPAIWTVRNIQF